MRTLIPPIVVTLTVAALSLPLFLLGLWIWGDWHDEWSGYNASVSVSGDGACNIAVVTLYGDIVPYHENTEDFVTVAPGDIRSALSNAEFDPYIEGVLLRIDSPGGTPAASEAIADRVAASHLPVVALVGDYGTSGAYLAATGADTIIASPFSDVGGLGVSMSYLENVEQNEISGLDFVSLTSAPFKDYGSPDRPLAAAERALIERDLALYHEHLITKVAENRGLSPVEVEELADGSTLPGALALEAKLIDALGTDETARLWFAEHLGITEDEVVFCEW